MPEAPAAAVSYLLGPRAIRERCRALLELGLEGRLEHFRVDMARLPAVADYVLEVTREAYPTLDIPVHSRWGHFDVGGIRRNAELEARLAPLPPAGRARAKLDLVVTSVLLDAGSGPTWKYQEPGGGTYARSEGLAVASFRMFLAGAFSSDPSQPLRADAEGLRGLSLESLAEGFQVTEDNPLAGLEGRLELLHGLGRVLPRPGTLFDLLAAHGRRVVTAAQVLGQVLQSLGPIWPGRITLDGMNLGDVWPHSALGALDHSDSLVPFHKLSQWLTYSLLEPLEEGGLQVTGLEELTGLPEYRNGGLLVDGGVLVPRDERLFTDAYKPGSEPIVEWRALTVALLDEVGQHVRERLGMTAEQLPLAKVLQGGTWSAGRKLAAQKRPGGPPPIRIESDGTVF
ncbi:URC4/urg3 family protein [Cystobacter ferrugineus]|uniref:Uracil phosphoribosyltransferase n=1 Tax=Cystobacter ferrugineus TaxID=83449 RepID=A0A1L9B218_9BACT|nr:URC4/urg3 family protein [Cystobacter ferrugineus]OJH36302.1 uracil phosphoribosyltransferase [Cystobacter ferrugineus]